LRPDEAKINLDIMGQILKKGNEVWFEYVIPIVNNPKDKMRQTGLRLMIDKEEKKIGVNKLALITNR
jgi:malate/lactate dehydrogenase